PGSPQKRAASPRKSPRKSPKKSPRKASASPRRAATHPPVIDMIQAAISAMKERKGSSVAKIKSYMAANYRVDMTMLGPHVRRALRNGVASGALKQVTGTGATGRFRVGAVAKPKKAKKTSAAAKAKKEKARARAAAKKAKAAAKRKAALAKKKAAAAKRKAATKAKKAKKPKKKTAAKKAKKPAAKKAKKPAKKSPKKAKKAAGKR
uniref:Histone H1 n=1 Tax=Parechinus angulosus TaxID=7658 RepID=Q7M409_PARAN